MKKGMIALICMVITLVFIIVALMGTWYSASGEQDGEEAYSNYGLTSVTTKSVGGDEETESYAEKKEDIEDDGGDIPDIYGVFDTAFYLTIIALIFAIIALIGMLGITFGFGNLKTMKMLAGIFAIIVLIFCLIAPIYFMTSFPGAFWEESTEKYGFWDEYDWMGSEVTLGPGYAWYLMIVGFVTALIASIIIFMDKPGAAAPMPPQQPMKPQQ